MRKTAEELRQKKMTKNAGYSVLPPPRENPSVATSYLAKPRVETSNPKVDFTSINPKPEYTLTKTRTDYKPATSRTEYYPPVQPKKDDPKIPSELKSFMEDDDEEVSVAFEELMTEIAKYEVDEKPQNK